MCLGAQLELARVVLNLMMYAESSVVLRGGRREPDDGYTSDHR